jgi:hypothetical protein
VAVAVTFAGVVGGVLSVPGPNRLVPNAASSNTMSHEPLVVVSPICMTWIGELPRSITGNVRPGTAAPSSHTWTELFAPATFRCNSTTCHPDPGVTELVVPVASASLRKPSFPPAVRYTYPPTPFGPSRSRNSVVWLPMLFTANATRAYASVYEAGKVSLAHVAPVVVFPSAA